MRSSGPNLIVQGALLTAFLLFQLASNAASVRASFLLQTNALRDTVDFLRSSGCSTQGVDAFRRAVERYSAEEFEFDSSKFPSLHRGFYAFESISNLVAVLPHQLCDTRHAYEFNCFDTVVSLTDGFLHLKRHPDDVIAPFLVPYTPTNGSFMILPRATARDAFMLAYPPWYREATEQALPATIQDRRICLTAALFRCYVLPQSTTDENVCQTAMDILRADWRLEEMKFPGKFELVLCHEINLAQHWFATAHAGLIFPRQSGFTYIEKAGGSGPFVRLDLEDKRDLLTWFAGMFKGAEKLGYTHHFATFNDVKIEIIESGKSPPGKR